MDASEGGGPVTAAQLAEKARACEVELLKAREGYARVSKDKVKLERDTARSAEKWKQGTTEVDPSSTDPEQVKKNLAANRAREPLIVDAQEDQRAKMELAKRQLQYMVEEEKNAECIRNARVALLDARRAERNKQADEPCRLADGSIITREETCEQEAACGQKCSFNDKEKACKVLASSLGRVHIEGTMQSFFLDEQPEAAPRQQQLSAFL